MSASNFWKKVKSSPAILHPNIRILDENVIQKKWSPQAFKAEENYFEIRITEQFLKDHREYWNEYIPLTVILSDFIYGDKKNSFPFVVGPDILKGLSQIKGHENIRYKNTRVAGPAPYKGDQLALFIGLFRLKSKDWAKEALGLLETVAKAFDSSKLSSYLSISNPLMDGIESFLGMGDQMQFRLGFRNEYEDPDSHSENQLKSGYHVMIRAETAKVNPKKLWVKENQLFIGDNKKNLKLYDAHDYILYELASLKTRNDYTTFDFHVKWKEIQDLIWKTDDKNIIILAYQHLISMLRSNYDLIDPHKKKLQLIYRAKFQKEWASKEAASNPFASLESLASDFFEKSTKKFKILNEDKNATAVITLSDEVLTSLDSALGIQRAPKELSNMDIVNLLNSPILDNNKLNNIDIVDMTSVLGAEMIFE